MAEQEKYYTPEIEEFCVGFEFEVINTSEGDCESINSINRSSGFAAFGDCFSDVSNYRVKFLDREDIESLGWEDSGAEWQKRITTTSCAYLKLNKGRVEMSLLEGADEDDPIKGEFVGTINNKSELQTIMKMIGIWKKQ